MNDVVNMLCDELFSKYRCTRQNIFDAAIGGIVAMVDINDYLTVIFCHDEIIIDRNESGIDGIVGDMIVKYDDSDKLCDIIDMMLI